MAQATNPIRPEGAPSNTAGQGAGPRDDGRPAKQFGLLVIPVTARQAAADIAFRETLVGHIIKSLELQDNVRHRTRMRAFAEQFAAQFVLAVLPARQ